ncbi:MAG TPA: DUF6457 domain-containing protein [Streptosporangiaceae bacterium]|nr:DUF6457 domain-containing protein [Streptosporangiaceae bacterium]
MNPLERWITLVAGELGLSAKALDRDAVLDVAKNAAHQVARPAAPLTTYLLGVAVGRGAQLQVAAETVNMLAAAWPETGGAAAPAGKRPAHPEPGRGT